MWAQRLVAPSTFARQEVAAPEVGDLKQGEVLLRILAGGICGSDLPFFKGALFPFANSAPGEAYVSPAGAPLHEVVGEVMATQDPEILVGSRVVGWAPRLNGLQEYLIVDGEGLLAYDPALSPATAVILQPLACVIYALEQFPNISGASAAVIGQGPIGVLFSHVLKAKGAHHVAGVDRVDRSDVASVFKIDEVVHASSDQWALSLRDYERPDLIVEAVGHQVGTMKDAVEALAANGHIFYFGIPDDVIYPFPMMTFLRKNAKLTSGITMDKRASLRKAADHLTAFPELIDAYVTNVFGPGEVQQAFELAVKPAKGRFKIVIEMT